MHMILIVNNMVFGFIPAVLGIPLFFIRPLGIFSLTYFRLMDYYISVIPSGTWLGERSVNYPSKDHPVRQEVAMELR